MDPVQTGLDRESQFGFSCARCRGCCRFKKIQLNPYEAGRLARGLGLSTTAFIDQYTTHGGTVLRCDDQGSCIFLDASGCAVHSDRPLVCRLYPLGRYVDFLGVETFGQLALEPGCHGRLHDQGTIARYLEEQGGLPFMQAADRYLDLLRQLLDYLQDQNLAPTQSAALVEAVRIGAEDRLDDQHHTWIDLDRTVADYCRRTGMPEPNDLDQRMRLHIQAVRQWTAQQQGGD